MEGLDEGLYHESQCVADADSYFVQQAMELSETSHFCVVAEDTDILIVILEKMPTSTTDCRPGSGSWDEYNDCNVRKVWEAYRYLLADTRQATTQAVSEFSPPEERSCTEKGRSQTAPSNFLGCEVSLPPGVSSNTGVAVQSSRSVWDWVDIQYWILAVNTNLNTLTRLWNLQPFWNRLVVAVNLTARLNDADVNS